MNERTTNPEFNRLIENYEKFAEVLKEEDPNITFDEFKQGKRNTKKS